MSADVEARRKISSAIREVKSRSYISAAHNTVANLSDNPDGKKSHAAHLHSKPDYSGRKTEHTETHMAIKSLVDFST